MNRSIDNIEVVYIGTDIDYYDPNIQIDGYDELVKKYERKKVILFPNRFEYLKRPILLAKVISEITKIRKDIICIAAGYGKAADRMKAAIQEYGIKDYFEIVGPIDDLRPYYKLANVTIICSLTEGLTLTAYESLAMGTPVVTADVGGQKELVDNTCGRVIKKYQSVEKDLLNFNYDSQEIEEYKNAIIELIDLKNEDLSKMCRKKVTNGFTIENMIEKIYYSFEKMVEKGTNVDLSICNNIEIAERYLMLFNDYYKPSYFNPDIIPLRSKKQRIIDKLWEIPLYRLCIKFLQRTGITKKIKYNNGEL